ncbi:MAG: ABC transporter ATP-binding protein [Clostridiales bacterium]|jgi:sulfate transport system ATP-binding protein|nr:ABC transporter ATP-binding protein [Clostridiales bacterium]
MYVELRGINKKFGSFKASDDISFSIDKGKLVGLLGPSGSGKTTILRMIAGLEPPDSGDVIVDGVRVNDAPPGERGVGFVFQNYALFRYMTVFDNIAFGLNVQKRDKKHIKERVQELIELTGLSGMEKRRPHQLSGGQKQRVAFARALAPNPRLLLLDEPFAAIDAKVRKELRAWLKNTISKVGITSVFVTHDQDEAIEVADEIIIINNGRIEQKGSPSEIYKSPTTPFAARFIGQSFAVSNYDALRGFEKDDNFPEAILRPEFITVSKLNALLYPNSTQDGVVENVFFRGNLSELRVDVAGVKISAYRSLEDDEIYVGEKVGALIYQLFLVNDREVKLIRNSLLRDENSVFI